MAETTKKFLDLTGLTIYDGKIKEKIAKDIKVVQDDVNTRKVKDTADSDTITWSKGADGTYTASVAGNVVVDADYNTVKTNANNSAAAWGKFLEGTTGLYPNNVTPGLKDLATTASVTKAVSDGDATTLASAKSYADGLAKNYDAAGAAAQALKDAKTYADGKASAAETAAKSHADSVAATAKSEAINAAKTYTDGEIKKVDDKIADINTSIAGGVHFIGISTTEITDKGTQTPTISGWTGPVKTGDIVINNNSEEFIWDGTKWQKLGDTTQESQRITALEGHVNTLRGNDTVEGSVAKALKDAKAFTTSEINTLVTTGQVKTNTEAIAKLNGGEDEVGSVNNAIKVAKAYADGVGSAAQSHTDTKIAELVGETGQVGINTAAITKLNGGKDVVGSVDYKIAQAVSNIEASIDTITEAEIKALFA